jgi:hyperosmotically inducible periplasmic protein
MKPLYSTARRSLLFAALALAPALGMSGAERGSTAESVSRASGSESLRRDSQSASRLIGSPVKTADNEKVGTVEDIFVDLESGRVSGVILSSGGFLGIGDALSIVQAKDLSRGAEGDLRLDISREKLAAAPRYDRGKLGERVQERWSDASDDMRRRRDREVNQTVGDRGSDRPYRPVDADNTARNRRDRDSSRAVDPLDQGNRRSDVETTARIRSAIVENDRLSSSAKNVKIITRDGQVTLRGPVATEEEKQIIAEVAARSAPGRVTNQLEVEER